MHSECSSPWYVSNASLHSDLLVPPVREVILHSFIKHIKKKLENHPNTSAITLLDNSEVYRRLQKTYVLDTEERSILKNWKVKLK